jgi:hypothetical protein
MISITAIHYKYFVFTLHSVAKDLHGCLPYPQWISRAPRLVSSWAPFSAHLFRPWLQVSYHRQLRQPPLNRVYPVQRSPLTADVKGDCQFFYKNLRLWYREFLPYHSDLSPRYGPVHSYPFSDPFAGVANQKPSGKISSFVRSQNSPFQMDKGIDAHNRIVFEEVILNKARELLKSHKKNLF